MPEVVVILTAGKADGGKLASLAFSCALSSVAMDHPTMVFLTSDGAVWGYQDSAAGIATQGFPPLQTLIDEFVAAGGRVILCSVCHRTCSVGGPATPPSQPTLPAVEFGGFATILELAGQASYISF